MKIPSGKIDFSYPSTSSDLVSQIFDSRFSTIRPAGLIVPVMEVRIVACPVFTLANPGCPIIINRYFSLGLVWYRKNPVV